MDDLLHKYRHAFLTPRIWCQSTEALIAAAVLVVLTTLWIPGGMEMVERSRFVGLFQTSNALRYELLMEHAASGQWPRQPVHEVVQPGVDLKVDDVLMTNGNVSLLVSKIGQTTPAALSFRKASGARLGTHFWYCGYASERAEAPTNIPNITSVPARNLPGVCRS